MKKVLIVTHVSGFVPQFEMNNVRILQQMGYEVHYASNFCNVHYGEDNHRLDGTGIVQHQVDFSRSPLGLCSNMRAYRQLKRLFKEHKFAMLHCHTPVASIYARLAASGYRKKRMKVLYTTHGFHFYDGAPLKYRLVYPIERGMARLTDAIITINKEDFRNARKFRLAKRDGSRGRVYRIKGVGIESELYVKDAVVRERKRQELGLAKDEFALVSVGELNRNKNHALAVEALGRLKHLKVRYFICGEGSERSRLLSLAEQCGVADRLTLTGFRKDIPEILTAVDAMVFPSVREGFGMAAIESLAAGLPVIATDNRGTREYMCDGVNGYVLSDNTVEAMAETIERMYRLSPEKYEEMKRNCMATAKRFDKETVGREMEEIYRTELQSDNGGMTWKPK